MIIIVGLGNPGEKYKNTRHNIGFRVIDELLNSKQITDSRKQKKFNSDIFEMEINKNKIILAKPQTFMNFSGKAVKKIVSGSRSHVSDLIVVHDDIDLPLGKIRIIKNRGSAGHKGVESIIKELGNKNFIRFRIGIIPKNGKPRNLEKFVLQEFSKEEKEIIEKTIKKTIKAILLFLEKGVEQAMNKYND